jgi:signal transduction histidine kinase
MVDVLDAPLLVDGDPVRLGQVISNLLSNAARYTNDGRPPGCSLSATALAPGAGLAVRESNLSSS